MKKSFLSLLILMTMLSGYAQKKNVVKIAFGSCSKESSKEQLWREVVSENPDLWVWLGDNIYGDTLNMDVLRAKYQKQKSNPDYQKLLKTCPVIGTWDDHDYGLNDGGKENPAKEQSKAEMLAFLNIPNDAPVRKHEGVYNAYTLAKGKEKVKIILLDTRYFRDPLNPGEGNHRYVPTSKGDFLGEAQWQWLENELRNSDASVNIIGTSIQFIASQHVYEKWMNLSASRDRMLTLLQKIKPKNTFMISGDRHIAEISKMEVEGLPYPLYDFTSSGLTHTWDAGWEENQYRVGEFIKQKNFGTITIEWHGEKPTVTFAVKGKDSAVYETQTVQY